MFNGKIIVRHDAQKTDAKQTNRALLLSDDASINTKPQLEIFADDVKCTHGAAIGQLDDDAIFYLRARGLTYLEARDMLIHAFAGEILERVKIEPLRVALEDELYTQLARILRRSTRHDARRRTDARPSGARRRAGAGGFPDSAPAGARQAARLSRQRGDDAEAAGGHRRDPRYYTEYNANVHRGVHELSEIASEAYEHARRKVGAFFNAPHEREIVFTRNATESINLVAHAFGRTHVGAGDEVLISAMEHHSNIVPWQLLCEERGARLRVAPIDDRGELMLDEFEALVGERTKIVAVTHMSNALGTINPVEEIIRIAHRRGVPVLIDGSQAAYHMPVDVQALDCDFYVATGHKLYGPTGMGILYGKEALLDSMPPFLGRRRHD